VTSADDGRSAVTAIRRRPAQFRVVLTTSGCAGRTASSAEGGARRESLAYVVMITGYATLDSALRAVREGAVRLSAEAVCPRSARSRFSRIRDRIALEAENRMLSRQMDGLREAGAGAPRRGDLTWRWMR
jgi:ActR/RegA family two-component response regulator